MIDAHARGEASAIPAQAFQALDVIMRHERSTNPAWVNIGRNFLSGDNKRPLTGGFECWLGYSLSARPTQSGTHLVVNTAAGAFVADQSAVDRLKAVFNGRLPPAPLDRGDHKEANKAFRNIKIELTHLTVRRRKTSRGLSQLAASRLTFREEGGREVSVATYFAEHYKIALKYPDLPCVACGSSKRLAYFPLEVCHVPAQRQQLLQDSQASASMIKVTALPPAARRRAIEDQVVKHIEPDPGPKAFNVRVNRHMAGVSGRVLDPPRLFYRDDRVASPRAGAWNLSNYRLREAPGGIDALNDWALVVMDPYVPEREARQLAGSLARSMECVIGLRVSENGLLVDKRGDNESTKECLRRVCARARRKFQLVYCLLPSGTGVNVEMYNAVKETAELDLGVPTQCMRHNPKKMNQQYFANVMQKVNAKLGGVNCLVSPTQAPTPVPLFAKPTLIFGGDVAHASPGSSSASVASVVGNVDLDASKYVARLSAQSDRREMIDDLEGMAREVIMAFYEANGGAGDPGRSMPQRVLFYRDGVSESQFKTALEEEVPALRRAFASLGDGAYAPPITFVVAQKRHNTRLFVKNPRDGEGRNQEVPAGTVVDSGVCHPTEYDFFLQSHSGIQGTTRPVHYHVLLDECGFGPDALQGLTFALAHAYCRCTRSVSVVPPVFYAHLAASRGAAYDAAKEDKSDTESFRSGDSGDQRWGGPGGGGGGRRDGRDGRDGRAPAPAPARRIDLRPELRNGMFFA